jgi:hypothetical protein
MLVQRTFAQERYPQIRFFIFFYNSDEPTASLIDDQKGCARTATTAMVVFAAFPYRSHEKIRKHRSLKVGLVVNVTASAVHYPRANRDLLVVHQYARVSIKVDSQTTLSGEGLPPRK